jgi:hypothetical protein
MSKIEVDAIEPQSGTSLTLGASGDTITIPSGATLTNSGTATGFGKVLQVVSAFTTTEATSASATYSDTGLTASITPSSASSKVLVLVQQSVSKAGATVGNIRVYRGATEIGGTIPGREIGYTGDGATNYVGIGFACSILDTPSSTSALTYKTQFNNDDATGTVRVQVGSGASYITLMEIAG